MMGDYLMFSQARRMRLDTFDLQSSESSPYRIRLGIPASSPPANGWPLILMLGGDAFDATCALIRYHADCRPPGYLDAGVLVSIDYPHENRRRLDYTPPVHLGSPQVSGIMGNTEPDINTASNAHMANRGGVRADAACPPDADQGGADRFLSFLLDTLLPALHNRLPLDASRQALAGHSLGGLFTLHVLLTQPGAFQTYIASSPSVWWGQRYLQRHARQLADTPGQQAAWRQAHHTHLHRNAASAAGIATAALSPANGAALSPLSIHISVGEFEQAVSPLEQGQSRPDLDRLAHTRQARAMIDGNREVAQALASIPGLTVAFQVYPGHYHRSVWPSALNLGLLAALRKTRPAHGV